MLRAVEGIFIIVSRPQILAPVVQLYPVSVVSLQSSWSLIDYRVKIDLALFGVGNSFVPVSISD